MISPKPEPPASVLRARGDECFRASMRAAWDASMRPETAAYLFVQATGFYQRALARERADKAPDDT